MSNWELSQLLQYYSVGTHFILNWWYGEILIKSLNIEVNYFAFFYFFSSAFSLHHGVGILRLPEGLDYSHLKVAGDDDINLSETSTNDKNKEENATAYLGLC